MRSEVLHERLEKLSSKTIDLHRAIVSLIEALEAIDRYQQRAEGAEDAQLREIILHDRNEEVEQACMVLEWIRRHDSNFDKQLRTYLFTEADILAVEEGAEDDY